MTRELFARWCRALFVPLVAELAHLGMTVSGLVGAIALAHFSGAEARGFGFLVVILTALPVISVTVKFRRILQRKLESSFRVTWRSVRIASGEEAEARDAGAGCLRTLISLALALTGFKLIHAILAYHLNRQQSPLLPVFAAILVMVVLWIWAMREFYLRIKIRTIVCLIDGEPFWFSREMSGYERQALLVQILAETKDEREVKGEDAE